MKQFRHILVVGVDAGAHGRATGGKTPTIHGEGPGAIAAPRG